MSNADIIKQLSDKHGIDAKSMGKIVNDYCQSANTMISRSLVRYVDLQPVGILVSKDYRFHERLDREIDKAERFAKKNWKRLENNGIRARKALTNYIDQVYYYLTAICLHHFTTKEGMRYGITKQWKIDLEYVDRRCERINEFVLSLPCKLLREKPSAIQIIVLQRLSIQGILFGPPKEKDCEVWPMRVRSLVKNVEPTILMSRRVMEIRNYRSAQGLQAYQAFIKQKEEENVFIPEFDI